MATKRTPKRASEAMPRTLVGQSDDAARLVRPHMHDEQETFVVICLTVRNTMIGEPIVIAIGTAHAVEVHPRDVFREAIRNNAAGIVVAHNHPSGDPSPSPEDRMLTERLVAVGKLVGIPVIDHVVVSSARFRSMAEETPSLFYGDSHA